MSQVLDKYYHALVNNVYCPWCGCVNPKNNGVYECFKCKKSFLAHTVVIYKYWTERIENDKI